MLDYRGIPIRWRQYHDGRRAHPDQGQGRHGIISMGSISKAKTINVHAPDTDWSWAMPVGVAGGDPLRSKGVAMTKAAAIAACDACYIALMEIEGNYERVLAHYLQIRISTEHYNRRGDPGFLARPRDERRAILERWAAERMHPAERTVLGLAGP